MKRLLAACALALTAAAPPDPLSLWPAADRPRMEAAIAAAPPGSFATFDADNTLWHYDIKESLLPWLANRGLLSASRLDPSLKPIPMLPGESLYGYYMRLCEVDDKLCYPWIAQAFAGLSLATLKREVDAMMASAAPIPVRYARNGRQVADVVMPPAIFAAQRQLIQALRSRGVRVYVVSASLEELVRMVASDPRYGLDVAPQDVIGVTALLRDPATGAVTTARQQIARGHFLDPAYPAGHHAAMVLTPTLWSPLTWQEGKVAAIQAYIDPVRRPIVAAGDSRSDWPMLFHAGAIRIWVDRHGSTTPALVEQRRRLAQEERVLGLRPPIGADAGWVVVDQGTL